MESSVPRPTCLGPCRLPAESALVTDADEEIFLLYTSLASQTVQKEGDTFRGLGYLDSRQDVLTLEFVVPSVVKSVGKGGTSKKKRGSTQPKKGGTELDTFEVLIAQDKTALRSRKGDTGSVLWRASYELAQLLLNQKAHPKDALLDPVSLADAHVLELGAGTGLLAVALSSSVRHYTVTDIDELVPLITKNLSLNGLAPSARPASASTSNVTAEALDWVTLKNSTPLARSRAFSYPPIELLLIVDCIYHPSLLPALVETIDYLATPEHTAVLVVVELRAEDVVREFLELWLAAGNGAWQIWHVEGVMKGPYAVWVGWKRTTNT